MLVVDAVLTVDGSVSGVSVVVVVVVIVVGGMGVVVSGGDMGVVVDVVVGGVVVVDVMDFDGVDLFISTFGVVDFVFGVDVVEAMTFSVVLGALDHINRVVVDETFVPGPSMLLQLGLSNL